MGVSDDDYTIKGPVYTIKGPVEGIDISIASNGQKSSLKSLHSVNVQTSYRNCTVSNEVIDARSMHHRKRAAYTEAVSSDT